MGDFPKSLVRVLGLWLGFVGLAVPLIHAEPHAAVGFAGKYKVGCWTPVRCTTGVSAASQISATILDGELLPVRYPADDEDRGTLYVRCGRVHNRLRIECRGENPGAWEQTLPPALSATQKLVLTLGPAESVTAATTQLSRGDAEPVVTAAVTPDELPRWWLGYEGVHAVVINGGDLALLQQLDDRQLAALELWLNQGGRLVLMVGETADKLLASDGRFARFAPGKFRTVLTSNNSLGLENYVSATKRLDISTGLPVCVLEDVRGRVEVYEGLGGSDEVPLVIRSPRGFGQLVFVAFDPERPPITDWPERTKVLTRVLQESSTKRHDASDDASSGRVSHVGYRDLTGQLRGTLERFRGVQSVTFSLVTGLLVLYIAFLGPGQYFLLKWLRRPGWMWVVTAVLIVGFCGLGFVLTGRLKGDRLLVNQVDVTDIDVETGSVRGTLWAHVYSPRTASFDLRLVPRDDFPGARASLAWQGLPGAGLGGLSSQAVAPFLEEPFLKQGYVLSGDRATGLPIHVGGTKSLVGRWWAELPDADAGELTALPNHALSGEIRNPLPFPLHDAMVLHATSMYRLNRSLAPGASVRIDGLRMQNLEWQLQRRNLIDSKDVSTPWDPTNIEDLPRLLEVMMFHEAAGGRGYTRLTNGYQPWLDLTEHLRTGRAVLLGRGEQPGADLQRDGESLADSTDQQRSLYRIVILVR